MSECRKYIGDIADYIDGELDQALCKELDKHLKECENCRIMVDSLRKTVMLCRDGKKESLPADLESRLNDAIRARWERKFGKT